MPNIYMHGANETIEVKGPLPWTADWIRADVDGVALRLNPALVVAVEDEPDA